MPTTVFTFLGTGNFYAPGRYWNSFVVNHSILFETPPTVLPNLRRAGINPNVIEVVFLSHFHADHTFGWPFLLHSAITRERRKSPLWVVGPSGVKQFLAEMLHAGRVDHLVEGARAALGGFDLHFVEMNEQPQRAGPVEFQAVRVEHDATLDCFGFLVTDRERTIGYSGDTRLCEGLRNIAAGADVLVLECNQRHSDAGRPLDRTGPPVHVGLDDVRVLRDEFPNLPLLLTHVNDDISSDGIPGVRVPEDFETIEI